MYRFKVIPMLFAAFSLLLYTAGCQVEDSPTEPVRDPELSVSATSLDFGISTITKSFSMNNRGGSSLNWWIAVNRNWIVVMESSGSITSETETITVTVNRQGLNPGMHDGLITVNSNGGSRTIPVTMIVPDEEPVLSVYPTSLNFGENSQQLVINISNNGGGSLNWNITDNQPWITISPVSGSTMAGVNPVDVTVSRDGMNAGTHSGLITVSSNGGTQTVPVYMRNPEADLVRFWFYGFGDNSNIDSKWSCFDDDERSGDDYWGATEVAHDGDYAAWCTARGNHPSGEYDNYMDSWMLLRESESVDISGYYDIVIKFWMAYETEVGSDGSGDPYDYVQFALRKVDGTWGYFADRTRWSGENWTWAQYEIPISWWGENISHDDLRMAFIFHSDVSYTAQGVLIDTIEIWGRPRI